MPEFEQTAPKLARLAAAVPRLSTAPSLVRTRALPLGRFALLSVVLLYLGAVLLGPLLAIGGEVADVGLGAALRALGTPDALAALRMSLVLTTVSAVVNAVVGTLGAIALVRHRFFGRTVVNALADLPLAISPVMIGLAFVLLVGRGGWLERPIEALGIKVLFSFPGLVLGTLFVTLPFTIREVAYVLEEIGTSEEEAAATLGASPVQTFFRVTLPNIRIGLGYGMLMTVARSLGEFGALLVIGGSISRETQTATTFISDMIDERETAGAYGMALVLALLSIGLWALLEWAKKRRSDPR
jgi:sulfate/thiosulfate transport system permease protein